MSETARVKPEKIRCDACPVMCFIAEGKAGACDRYANHAGELVRLDPLTVIERGAPAVAFLATNHIRPMLTRPSRTAITTESTCIVQKGWSPKLTSLKAR